MKVQTVLHWTLKNRHFLGGWLGQSQEKLHSTGVPQTGSCIHLTIFLRIHPRNKGGEILSTPQLALLFGKPFSG